MSRILIRFLHLHLDKCISVVVIFSSFWSTLLIDALPLLECSEIVFSADDTYEIMHCVEERVLGIESDEKIELLRLALSRNLARTLLMDDAESVHKMT